MTRRSPRYLSANGPVNPRTAPTAQHTRGAVGASPDLVARQRCRAQLGPGLRRQPLPKRTGVAPTLRRALGRLALGVSIGSLALAALQGTCLWLLAAVAASGVGWVLRSGARATQASAGIGLDTRELDAFDRLLAAVAAELSDAQRTALRDIKTLIVEIAGQADAAAAFDDQLYTTACVRRYVPDSLSAFVAVPAAMRADPTLASGGSADALLTQQLELLRAQLQKRRLRAARGTVAPLLRQQRFLETQGERGRADEPA